MKRQILFVCLAIFLSIFLAAQEKVASIKISPEKVELKPGQQCQFTAKGYSSDEKEVPLTAEWDATGGEVTQTGLYTAGTKSGVHSVMVTCAKTGVSESATVMIRADDMQGFKVVPATPKIEGKEVAFKNPYFEILEWSVKAENETLGGYFIKGRIESAEVASIKLLLFPKTGVAQTLLQSPVAARGQIFQFKGKYIRKSTESIAIDAYCKAGKSLYVFKQHVERIIQVPATPIPGGYLAQNPEAEDMQKMAKKTEALMQKEYPDYKLIKVHEAATQVVAGTNYFFVLEFQTSQKKVKWQVIVYEHFSGACSITKKEAIE